MTDDKQWWGDYPLQNNEWGHWHIGPLRLWVHREQGEWRLILFTGGHPLDNELQVEIPCSVPPDETYAESQVFVSQTPLSNLYLTPITADRAVMSRPDQPFYILPHESVEVFISLPLWLRVQARPDGPILWEVPFYRPSDTWFGPTTLEGELCYASKTPIYLSEDHVPHLPHRAITRVQLENGGNDALLIENLNLPVPYLSLYGTDQGHLHTESVVLRREDDSDLANLRVGKAPEGQLLQSSRLRQNNNFVIRAFSALWRSEYKEKR